MNGELINAEIEPNSLAAFSVPLYSVGMCDNFTHIYFSVHHSIPDTCVGHTTLCVIFVFYVIKKHIALLFVLQGWKSWKLFLNFENIQECCLRRA